MRVKFDGTKGEREVGLKEREEEEEEGEEGGGGEEGV
jgi:hypothetical protein